MSRMRWLPLVLLLADIGFTQTTSVQPSFEIASIRPSEHLVGPDYNNQISDSPGSFTARNVTLRWLVAEAWHCQRYQIIGPSWLDSSEYDIQAREPEGSSREQIPAMLRSLLSDRFHLKEHSETHNIRVYELTIAPGGPHIHPLEPSDAAVAGPGFHFHGDMRQFAGFLAVQISIPAPSSANVPVIASGSPVPVLDKTSLEGTYDFSVDLKPEIGTDGFTSWKRALEEQLGLKIASNRADVEFVVIDDALKIPMAN